ncbi:MAG TPA: hypothetical protein VJV79_13255 [Polyangiaceae bacterium]|nr:hypothetical protein [Polyangiaceae bacterium]
MQKFRVICAHLLLLGLPLAVLASARPARAQPARTQPAHADRVQNEVFEDDLLNADLGAPFGARVFAHHLPPARTQLIRPRTNFLPALYKSIEQL